MKGLSIQVSGKVQGVFYRASTVEEATRLNLKGTVENLPNGDVYIEAFGAQDQLENLVSWCKQGPPLARVEKLYKKEIPWKERTSFAVIY